jgi:hypothetical protein
MALYLVETITTFRHYYVIDCLSEEHAEDTVVMEEAAELDQKYLGETIVSTRQITQSEYDALSKESINNHMGDKMIHTVNYDV